MSYIIRCNEREITRRGVLWLGLKCDVKCKFCYDENVNKKEKLWVPLEDTKRALSKFRNYYGNRYVDFMGGEPTLHPKILDIVKYSSDIGLKPTLITHGMHLADFDRALKFKNAGVHDFLMSIHGVNETVADLHGVNNNNYNRQLKALENLKKLNIPVRFNCILIKDNLEQLIDVVELANQNDVKVINFLTFNPYFEWKSSPEITFQAKHSEIVKYLKKAIELCLSYEIEANVRYMPICQLKGFESHIYTGYQLPYDTHEWDYNSWYDRGIEKNPSKDWYYSASQDQQHRHAYKYTDACMDCSLKNICDGFHEQYLERWGGGEAKPYKGNIVTDPEFYIRNQKKYEYEDHEEKENSLKSSVFFTSLDSITQFNNQNDNRAGVKDTYFINKQVL